MNGTWSRVQIVEEHEATLRGMLTLVECEAKRFHCGGCISAFEERCHDRRGPRNPHVAINRPRS